MKLNTLFIFSAIYLLINSVDTVAQIKVEFNEKGQMTMAPPDLVKDNEKLLFTVHVSDKFYNDRLVDWYHRYRESIRLLDSVKDKPQLYGLPLNDANDNIKKVITSVQGEMAADLLGLLKEPRNKKVLSLHMNITDEETALEKYPTAEISTLNIPSIMDLILPKYALNVSQETIGGFKQNTIYKTVPLRFIPDKSLASGYIYTLEVPQTILNKASIHFKYQLVLQNNVYDELEKQLDTNRRLQDFVKQFFKKFKIEEIQKEIDERIATAFGKSTGVKDSDKLLVYLGKKESGVKTTEEEVKAAEKVVNVEGNLTKINTVFVKPKIKGFEELENKQSIEWLVQFAWIINPLALTANPFASEPSNVSQIKALNASLQKERAQLLKISQEAALIENKSKVSGTGIGENENLLQSYSSKLKEKLDKEEQIAALQTNIDNMKKKSSDVVKSETAVKSLFLRDSLLYDGDFLMNQSVFDPNHKGYLFMRHHDASNDFHLMGSPVAKQVNERQRMYVLVENATKPTGYVLSTVITPIALKDDIDLPGAEVSNAFSTNESLKAVYENFVLLKRILNPYRNGLLTLPLQPLEDETPNYRTRVVSHEVPPTAPSLITYQIMDTVAKVNANSEKTVYQYRMNKLYRFRIKAGMVYSFLERRNYTIDAAANTSTYTLDRGGLGAAVGIQIFPSRLDIQKAGFLPQPVPFFYIGYQITDAPANNFLLGGGLELFSGVAVTGGIHFGKTERLTVNNGILQKNNFYDTNGFIGLSVGLEAFDALFNKAKPSNPFNK